MKNIITKGMITFFIWLWFWIDASYTTKNPKSNKSMSLLYKSWCKKPKEFNLEKGETKCKYPEEFFCIL